MMTSASGDKTAKLWNLDGEELQTLIGHQDMVVAVNFSPDGGLIATASSIGQAKLWSLDWRGTRDAGNAGLLPPHLLRHYF